MRPSLAHLTWPFFDEVHRRFGADLAGWAKQEVGKYIDHDDVDDSCRSLVRALGKAGWLRAVVQRRTEDFRKNSMYERCARRVKYSHGTIVWPILPSPCRD